ncbi:MAG: hypothetical protein RMK84_10210 [Oscillochloridaceae bacterium]|nr:hypothetical protein [Chloroflexaceae bacterium]MDW8390486.1 hypothetical protein [Oscillochloridaceae bacterium]
MEHFPVVEAARGLVVLLERHSAAFPQLGEELERHRRLSDTLAEQRARCAQALTAWRAALARRWQCEVAAQRIYADARRKLRRYYHDSPAHARVLAPTHADHAYTASALLQEVLRLAATLEVVAPLPPFAAELRAELRAAADDLAAAIEQTADWEVELRRQHTAERMAVQMALQASERSRRLLSQYVGDEVCC